RASKETRLKWLRLDTLLLGTLLLGSNAGVTVMGPSAAGVV
ncbi:MAG: hypothetical protein ACI89E_001344, partial [Planctomycetota bacterium]